MKRKKVVRRYRWVDMDKSITLKDQIQALMPCTELEFYEFLDRYGKVLEVRSIGYVDRYYNDYGDLLAVQDGIEKLYLKGGLNGL